jgi:polyadenylation factor subunit 2
VKYWQSTMNNLKAFKAHKEPVRDISLAPNDLHFVTCSDDQTASIWDLETSKEVLCLKGHGWDVKAAKWHPTKGIIITGSKDQLIKVWDPRSGAGGNNHGRNPHCLADIHAHKNTVNRLAWSPLNPHWFLSGSRDNLVKLFDIRIMKDFQTMRAHKKEITSLAWHPTSERLFASGSHDGAIHHWFVGDSETQGEITGAHDSAVHGLQWSPSGNLLASASNDHTTRFWARNRPGDDMTDKYNVASLPAAAKAQAVSTLVEAAKMNPSKYSRLPASLAEFAQQGQQELAEATAKSAYEQSQSHTSSSEFIPGMGGGAAAAAFVMPGMGAKKEVSYPTPAVPPSGSGGAGYNAPYAPPALDQKAMYQQRDESRVKTERKRSRSRSREREQYSRSGAPSSSSTSNARYAPPQPAPQSGGPPPGGYNAFFPPPPPNQGAPPQQMVPHQQQQQAAFFPPPPPAQPQMGGPPPPHIMHNPQRPYPGMAPPPQQFPPPGNYPPPHQQGGFPQPGGYPGGFPPPPQQQFQGYPPQQQPFPGQGPPPGPYQQQPPQQQRYQR